MQRTFVTEKPETLAANQVVVDLPRYEMPLARALLRRDINRADKFLNGEDSLNIPPTTLNQIKTFVDELGALDKEIDVTSRIPYTNYVGLQFNTVADAVRWARQFVSRFFPATEERLLKRQLLMIPLDKTEIVWVGGDKYLSYVKAVATAPSSDELVQANAPSGSSTPVRPQLSMEDVAKKRAEIAARAQQAKEAKEALKAANKGGKKEPETQIVSTDPEQQPAT